MPTDRDSVVALATTYIGRSLGTDTTTIPAMVELASDLIGLAVSNVYDEQRWQHTIDQPDIDNKVGDWQIPSTTKFIKSASLVDTTGSDDIIYPLYKVSNERWSKINSSTLVAPQRNYNTNKPTFADIVGRGRYSGRIDARGIPQFYTRIGNNIFVNPSPEQGTLNWEIRILLAIRPVSLVAGSTQNSLTINYERALALVASAMVLSHHLPDPLRARSQMNTASGLLQSIADENELSKLRDSVVNLPPT